MTLHWFWLWWQHDKVKPAMCWEEVSHTRTVRFERHRWLLRLTAGYYCVNTSGRLRHLAVYSWCTLNLSLGHPPSPCPVYRWTVYTWAACVQYPYLSGTHVEHYPDVKARLYYMHSRFTQKNDVWTPRIFTIDIVIYILGAQPNNQIPPIHL